MKKKPTADPQRRAFVNWFLGTSLGATVAAAIYPILQFLIPPEITEAQQNSVVAAEVNDVQPNSAKIFKFGSRPGILIRTPDGNYHALSAICTHLDCTVQYRPDRQDIWCACHGGVFDVNGNNVSGPPPRPLDRYNVNVSGEDILVSKS